MKSTFIIAIAVAAMIGVMIPSVFAANDNVTIEGNLNPFNRSEELYVAKFDAVSKMTEVTFSIYSIDDYAQDTIFSSSSFVNSGGTFQNFYVKFFPPLFKDDMTYAIQVTGDGLLGRQLLTINSEFTSYNSEVEDDQSIHEQEYAKLIEEQEAEQRAAEQEYAKLIQEKEEKEKAAEQRAAEQRAAEKKAAEQRAAEQRAAEQRAAEQRAAEARAQAAIRAAEAKAAQDLTNLLIIGGIAIIIISVAIVLAKRKNKKSNTPQRSTTSTYSPPTPPPSPTGNTESSTMFFYECPKCHSGDIQNNPDGSVNCPSCGYTM